MLRCIVVCDVCSKASGGKNYDKLDELTRSGWLVGQHDSGYKETIDLCPNHAAEHKAKQKADNNAARATLRKKEMKLRGIIT